MTPLKTNLPMNANMIEVGEIYSLTYHFDDGAWTAPAEVIDKTDETLVVDSFEFTAPRIEGRVRKTFRKLDERGWIDPKGDYITVREYKDTHTPEPKFYVG